MNYIKSFKAIIKSWNRKKI